MAEPRLPVAQSKKSLAEQANYPTPKTLGKRLSLAQRQLRASIANPFFPNTGTCGMCRRNWNICQGHTTWFVARDGMFPLCQECWEDLTPEERLPYYKKLWEQWRYGGDYEIALRNGVITEEKYHRRLEELEEWWPLIEKAVLAGH